MSEVFRTIAIPTSGAAKAQQIAYDLGYPVRGMFVANFYEVPPGTEVPGLPPPTPGTPPTGVMSSGYLPEDSPILKDEFTLYAAVLAATPGTTVTQQDCIDFVTARDQTTEPGVPRQTYLIEEVAAGTDAPAWVQPTGAHDTYEFDAMVSYKGYSYKSLIDANVWAPDVTGWRIVWGQQAGYAPWQQPLGAQDAYKLEAKVNHNGKNWNNTGSDANVWEPGVFGWTEIV